MNASGFKKSSQPCAHFSHFAANQTLETTERVQYTHLMDGKTKARGAGACPRSHRENLGLVSLCSSTQPTDVPPISARSPDAQTLKSQGKDRGREAGLLPYPPGTLAGCTSWPWLPGGGRDWEQRRLHRGAGAGLQAHQVPWLWRGGGGPGCCLDTEPHQPLLCLSEFHILFRWLCGAQGTQLSRLLGAQELRPGSYPT